MVDKPINSQALLGLLGPLNKPFLFYIKLPKEQMTKVQYFDTFK